jgi:hypothetical protein
MVDPTGMVGDYFSSNGVWLGHDGRDDQKVYFAREFERKGNDVILYKDSIRKTTFAEVLKAQDRAVAITPGTDNPIQDLVQSTGQNLNDSLTGLEIGARNTVTGAANALTNPLGPAGAAAGVPNPLGIAPLEPGNAKQAAYAFIAETGITAMATAGVGAAAAGPASAGSSLSVVPEVENVASTTTGLQRQLQLHQDKLVDYARNPYAHDNKGFLRNSPESRHAKIIAGRVRNLVQQIRNYEKQINK